MKMKELRVKLPKIEESSYPIIIGEKILQDAFARIQEYSRGYKFLIVTNEVVYGIWGKMLNLPNSHWLVSPDGEQFKNFDILKSILDKALAVKLERSDAIVAFGGGVIGDMAGFAASIYQRGIDFIQIPTTLLAQVDSSVGGKVAINHEVGKNLIGAFYQPKLVLSDVDVLKSLDERQFKTGLAEVVKYAFIEKNCAAAENHNLFEFLLANHNEICQRDSNVLSALVCICCELKSAVVFQDEKEQGVRAVLNFGHTFAHAIEKVTNYVKYTHGEAVAIGMKMALNLSQELGLISDEYRFSSLALLEKFGLIYNLSGDFSVEEICDAMILDKKVQNSKIRFVLPIAKSEVNIFDNIDKEILKKVVAQEL